MPAESNTTTRGLLRMTNQLNRRGSESTLSSFYSEDVSDFATDATDATEQLSSGRGLISESARVRFFKYIFSKCFF